MNPKTKTIITFGLAAYLFAFPEAGKFGGVGAVSAASGQSSVFPKVITPNNDGINDVVFFFIENATATPWEGTIYDLRSNKVADLKESAVSSFGSTVLTWDGKDDSGATASGGIYIYKIEVGERTYSGCVGVAR